MDVPGLVSTDAKAAYLAAKLEASRPKPAPVAAAAQLWNLLHLRLPRVLSFPMQSPRRP